MDGLAGCCVVCYCFSMGVPSLWLEGLEGRLVDR